MYLGLEPTFAPVSHERYDAYDRPAFGSSQPQSRPSRSSAKKQQIDDLKRQIQQQQQKNEDMKRHYDMVWCEQGEKKWIHMAFSGSEAPKNEDMFQMHSSKNQGMMQMLCNHWFWHFDLKGFIQPFTRI